jgi:hypothetical protein
VRDTAARGLTTTAFDNAFEQVPVLAQLDGLEAGADQWAAVFLEDASLVQKDGRIERRLAAQGRQDGVGAFLGDDRLDDLGRDRLDVGGIGELGVGHDRGRVGVDQDDPETFLTQDPAGLRSGVVELAGLADHDRAGPDDQDAVDVGTAGHQALPSDVEGGWAAEDVLVDMSSMKRSKRYAESCGPAAASGWY